MALTRGDAQILWSSANSITLTTNSAQTSDAYTLDATDVAAAIQISADNQGTPASGDYVDVWIAYTTGDVLGDSGDDYDTTEHAQFLMRLDTFGSNTPGEDPARKTVPLDSIGAKGLKIIVQGNQAATRNVVVRARVSYQRAA